MKWRWPKPGRVHSAYVAPDGRHSITVNSDGTIYIVRMWDPAAADRLMQSCDEVLKRDPNNVEALVARGRARLAKNQVASALADADAALNLAKEHTGATRLRATTLYFQGLRLADESKYAEARARLAEAVRLDPMLTTSPPVHLEGVPSP
jgi:tetratricopeptide (TPR) repeat protein